MAAYNQVKLRLYGTILSTQTWSTSCTLMNATWGGLTNADLSTWLTSIDAASQALWTAATGLKTLNSAQTSYVGIKAQFIAAGSSVASAAADHPFSAALAGAGTSYQPTQSSLVCSMRTPNSGRHYMGRMYLPCTAVGLSSLHKLTTTDTDNASNSMKTFLQALNASSIAGAAAALIVPGNVATPAFVTSIRVDNELDIQRRRADKIAASYTKTNTI